MLMMLCIMYLVTNVSQTPMHPNLCAYKLLCALGHVLFIVWVVERWTLRRNKLPFELGDNLTPFLIDRLANYSQTNFGGMVLYWEVLNFSIDKWKKTNLGFWTCHKFSICVHRCPNFNYWFFSLIFLTFEMQDVNFFGVETIQIMTLY
jgi:hypothetical protein